VTDATAPIADADLPPVRRVRWAHAFRIIPTRFPPVSLFERLGDPAEWDVLAELESLTNPRIRCEIGEISAVPPEERIAGPGASWVMGPFVHKRPSRFADGSFGAYYCANRRATAVAETCWHMERFYASTAEAALDVDMRVLVGSIDDRFHDLRDDDPRWRPLLDPADYTHSRAFAVRLRTVRSRGVVFPSVRDPGGLCVGAFTPRAVLPPRPTCVLRYHWDGQRIPKVFDFATEQWLDR
jgi:hypothetical protein